MGDCYRDLQWLLRSSLLLVDDGNRRLVQQRDFVPYYFKLTFDSHVLRSPEIPRSKSEVCPRMTENLCTPSDVLHFKNSFVDVIHVNTLFMRTQMRSTTESYKIIADIHDIIEPRLSFHHYTSIISKSALIRQSCLEHHLTSGLRNGQPG